MKRKFLFILIFTGLQVTAQQKKYGIAVGDVYQEPQDYSGFYEVADEKDGVFQCWMGEKELTVWRLDPKTLKKTGYFTLTPPGIGRDFASEKIVHLGGRYYLLHSKWDKDTKKELLFYDELDLNNHKILQSDIKIREGEKIVGKESVYQGHFGLSKYQFFTNNTSSSMSGLYRFHPEKSSNKKNYERIGLLVLDDQMHLRWEREYKMPYTEAMMGVMYRKVDNAGNVYFFTKIYNTEKRVEVDKETGKQGYHYSVFVFTAASSEIQEIVLDMGDKFVQEVLFKENTDNRLLFACTYLNKPEDLVPAGAMIATVDSNSPFAQWKKYTYSFPADFAEKMETLRKIRKGSRKNNSLDEMLKLRDAIIEKDGTAFLALEDCHHETEQTYLTQRMSDYRDMYHLGDVFAIKLGADNQPAWFRQIPKEQVVFSDYYSFKVISDAGSYHIIYPDNIKNEDFELDQEPAVCDNSCNKNLVAVNISREGKISKEIIFTLLKKDGFKIHPSSYDQFGEGQYYNTEYRDKPDYYEKFNYYFPVLLYEIK